MTDQSASSSQGTGVKPLKITCTSSNCSAGLHCFKQTARMAKGSQSGRCRVCGADLVDWKRVHKQDARDWQFTFKMLKYEMIRHHFWHVPIDAKAVAHARRKGRKGMREAAEKRIRTSVGPATPAYDGRQTPREGNALYYAQHATAACCRKCIAEWHGIPMDRPLSEGEIGYLTKLVTLYVEERLPNLREEGEHVPIERATRARTRGKS